MKKRLFLLLTGKLLGLDSFCRKQQQRLEQDHDITLELNRARFVLLHKVLLDHVVIHFKKHNIEVVVEQLSLSFNFKNFRSTHAPIKTIDIKNIQIYLGKNKMHPSDIKTLNRRKLSNDIPKILRFINILIKESQKIIKIANTISLSDISVSTGFETDITAQSIKLKPYNNHNQLTIENCNIRRQKHQFINLSLSDVLYKIRQDEDGHQHFDLDGKINNISLYSPLLSTEILEYEVLSTCIMGKVSDKEMMIEKTSLLTLGEISSFISASISEELICGHIDLIQTSLARFLKLLNKFTNKKIYTLKASGTIGLFANLLFDLKKTIIPPNLWTVFYIWLLLDKRIA